MEFQCFQLGRSSVSSGLKNETRVYIEKLNFDSFLLNREGTSHLKLFLMINLENCSKKLYVEREGKQIFFRRKYFLFPYIQISLYLNNDLNFQNRY